MKICVVILLAILCCATGVLAEYGVIPVERARIFVPPPPVGYGVNPYDGAARIYVPPPPPPPPDWQYYPQAVVPSTPPNYSPNTIPNPMPNYMPPMPVWTPDVPVWPSRQGSFGIGLCYTGPLARYFVTDGLAVELRDYINDDANVIAPRLMGLFDLPKTEFYEFCYYGIEVGHVNFRGRVSRGGGTTAGCFIGIEKEIFKDVMLNVDAGPYWISIKDNQTGIRETGVDFVVNSSIVWMLR